MLVNPQAEPHPLLINKSLKFGLDSFSLGLLQRGISDNPTAFSPLGLSEIGRASCANKKKKKKEKKERNFGYSFSTYVKSAPVGHFGKLHFIQRKMGQLV